MKPFRDRCPHCGQIIEGAEQSESPFRYVWQTLRCSSGHTWHRLLYVPVALTSHH